jgi:hypothetical protein
MSDNISAFIKNISDLCEIEKKEDAKLLSSRFDHFSGQKIMPFDEYIKRHLKYYYLDETIVLTCVHIFFVKFKALNYHLAKDNLYKLFALFVVLFMKIYTDNIFPMSSCSTISMISMYELLNMEIEILSAFNWNYYITKEEYDEIAVLYLK